jgi:NADH-quinone oxidoreductase subunit L
VTALGATALVVAVVLPAVVGALLLVAGQPAHRVAAPISVLSAAVVAAASVPAALSAPGVATRFLAGAELGLVAIGPARVLLPLLTVVTLLVVVAATGLDETAGEQAARFHGYVQLFLSAATLTVLATSLPALLLGWEVMGATSCALVAMHWRETRHAWSGTTAFLTTRAGDLGLYVAAGAALAGGAGLALDDLAATEPGWRHVVAAGVLVAALGKAAQLPFSFWLDRAMDGPAPVSALLHSAAMVALGGYLAIRVAPLLAATRWADDAAAWAGATTAVLLGAVALAQTDLKRALAASTAAQLGFVIAAAGVVGGVTAGTAHLLGHAGVKAALFLAAGVWLQTRGTRDLAELAGALRRSRLLGAAVTLALLALAGLPPWALWATKDLVLAGALKHSAALYAALLVAAALSSAYAVRLLALLARSAAGTAGPRRPVRTVGPAAVPVVGLLSLGGLAGGLLAVPAVAEALATAVGAKAVHPTVVELLVSAAVALAVAAATVVVVRRVGAAVPDRAGPLATWLGLEPLAHRRLVRPTLAVAERLDRVDDRLDRLTMTAVTGSLHVAALVRRADAGVIDAAVRGTATGAIAVASLVRRADVGVIDAAVRGTAAGARRAARAVLRPQTGQLHHYYLQTVIVLGVAVVVLAGVAVLGIVR